MKFWRVKYTFVFSSSSGMEPYSIDHQAETLIATSSDSIGSLLEILRKHHGHQCGSFCIETAEFLGTGVVEGLEGAIVM